MPRLGPHARHQLAVLGWAAVVVAAYFLFQDQWHALLPGWALWVLFIGVYLAGYIVVLVGVTRRWRRLARELGLSPDTDAAGSWMWLGMPDLVGQVGAHHVRVRTYRTGGRNRTPYTTISAAYEPAGPPFVLRVEAHAPWDHWGRKGGDGRPEGRDLTTGDDAFDERFRVACDRPELARRVLGLGVRDALSRLDDFGRITATIGTVEDRLLGYQTDTDTVRAHLDAVVRLAGALEREVLDGDR